MFGSDSIVCCAVYRSVEVLSLSDHRPIWAQVIFPTSDGSRGDVTTLTVRVASHNVQEMVEDGVSTYVCSMTCVHGSRGSGHAAHLKSAMLSGPARVRHTQRVLDMLRSQLVEDSTADTPPLDAVCLQEVDLELLRAIQAEAKSTRWSVHANATAQEPEPGTGRCSAITAIVSHDPPIRVLPDVVVEVSDIRKRRAKVRRHAAVVLANGVALVSVHVLHCEDKLNLHSGQPSNAKNIEQTERALIKSCGGEGCRCVLAVGDWNGSVSGTDEIEVRLAIKLLLRVLAASRLPVAKSETLTRRDYYIFCCLTRAGSLREVVHLTRLNLASHLRWMAPCCFAACPKRLLP
jgi:hypothetical protein